MFDSVEETIDLLQQHHYITDTGLATCLFLSQKLGKAVFLEGEPGVGKTEIARVLSQIFDTPLIRLQCYEGLDINHAVYEWNYPRQLLEIQSRQMHSNGSASVTDDIFVEKFLLKRPLLQAIDHSHRTAPVLLIDELDRADEEFESFLLELLSDFQITIPEIGTLRAKHRPIIIITSNRTREIHDALKRRCVYFWIDYPSREKELKILRLKLPGIPQTLSRQVVDFVQQVRQEEIYKSPGVSESLDWAEALGYLNIQTLSASVVNATLGFILKYQDDVNKIQGQQPNAFSKKCYMKPNNVSSISSDHFVENMLSLVDCLRLAGLPVSTDQALDFLRALAVVNIGERTQVYHAARCLLVSRREHLLLFETIFNMFWNMKPDAAHAAPMQAPHAPRHDHQHHQPVLVTYMATKARAADPELDIADKSGTYSDLELLQRKDFSQMTPEELDAVRRLMQAMRWQACFRQSRRRVASRSGDTLHMRRVIASAVRHGGVPLALAWQSRKIKQRPIVLLADISGSMEKYSRLVLQFFYSLSHSLKNVECFVFATRLTRITPQLKLKNMDRAVSQAAAEVVDWASGTRIGESLAAFNRQWSRRILHCGAIVMIVSDGWERGDVANLVAQMRYLQLRCYRLIWLNPLVGKVHYQPQVEGMAAALPFVDDFLPVHNMQSLSTLAAHLAAL